MQEATHANVAQSNAVWQSNRCNRGNMECTYTIFDSKFGANAQIHIFAEDVGPVCVSTWRALLTLICE
jgi:hypothetical protein